MNPSDNHHQLSPDMLASQGGEAPFNVPELPVDQPAKAEQVSMVAELPQVQPVVPVANHSADVHSPLAPPPPPAGAVQPGFDNGTPIVADDNDLIEQEWVSKAKAIVEKTREDPHLQNKEINKFKADYIKKRYDKDVKLNED